MHTISQWQETIVEALRLEETGVPIYVQLRDQLLRTLRAGLLRPGDQMPTMRQVAVALRVDLNTVRHAYDELERMGAITLERGRGSFVAKPPPPPEDPEVLAAQLDSLARQTIATANALGLDPGALARRISGLASQEMETP